MSSLRTQSVSTRDLAELMGAFARKLMSESQQEFFRAIETHRLSFTQMKLLMCVSANGEASIGVSACADALGLSPAGMSRAVESLVERGLLSRQEQPEDRRVKLVNLTPAGAQVVEELQELRIAGFTRFAERLAPELRGNFAEALSAVLAETAMEAGPR